MIEYTIITVNDRQYHVSPECARMLEAVCKDKRYQDMFAIPFEWLRLTVNQRGKSVKVEMAGG
jgi:hypothetical protein